VRKPYANPGRTAMYGLTALHHIIGGPPIGVPVDYFTHLLRLHFKATCNYQYVSL